MPIQLCSIHTVRKQHETNKKHFLHSNISPGSDGLIPGLVHYASSSSTFCSLQFSKFLH